MLEGGDLFGLWAHNSGFGEEKAEERDGKTLGWLEFPRIDQVVLVAKVDRKILVAGVVGRSVWSFNHGYGSS